MRKWIFSCLAVLAVTASEAQAVQSSNRCEGFLPKNDLRIEVGANLLGGLTKSKFDRVLDRIEKLYSADIRARGGRLVISRNWTDPEVNASAEQISGKWYLRMFGGLARHSAMTEDGYALVACHELGHHLGGAPKYRDQDWASNEGEADYFANLKCMRRYFENDDNEKILAGMKLDATAVSKCEAQQGNKQEQQICIRSAMAGVAVAYVFQALSREPLPRLNTPDKSKVAKTDDEHPHSQCRLDTYFNSALCPVPVYRELSDSDYRVGTCTDDYQPKGRRPRCWFRPN